MQKLFTEIFSMLHNPKFKNVPLSNQTAMLIYLYKNFEARMWNRIGFWKSNLV